MFLSVEQVARIGNLGFQAKHQARSVWQVSWVKNRSGLEDWLFPFVSGCSAIFYPLLLAYKMLILSYLSRIRVNRMRLWLEWVGQDFDRHSQLCFLISCLLAFHPQHPRFFIIFYLLSFSLSLWFICQVSTHNILRWLIQKGLTRLIERLRLVQIQKRQSWQNHQRNRKATMQRWAR